MDQKAVLPRRSQTYPLSAHGDRKLSPPAYSLYTFTTPTVSNVNMGADRAQNVIQPPRPPNAWILYRSDKIRELPPLEPGAPRRAQADVSKLISRMWRGETEAVKAEYEKKADVKKAEHQARYPNYRFQPMKRSEKDKLREQSRTVGEKDARKSRRAAPYPPTAPAYQVAVQYSHLPYLNQVAPSPPLSAASSSPSSPNPFPRLHLDQESPVYDRPSSSHSVPTTRQVNSSSPTPSLGTDLLPSVVVPTQAPSPAPEWPSYDWNQEQGSIPWLLSQDQGNQLAISEPQVPTMVSLEMPKFPEEPQLDVHGWNAAGSRPFDFMDAMFSATGDPSIFQAAAFDPSLLTLDPPSGSEIAYPPVQDLSSLNAWIPDFTPLQDHYTADHIQNHTTFRQDQLSIDELTSQQQQEMLQYLNFSHHVEDDNAESATGASGQLEPLTPQHTAPNSNTSTYSYVPPPGATNVGRRVVAGRWKPPPMDDDSPPHSPELEQSTSWGVRAVS